MSLVPMRQELEMTRWLLLGVSVAARTPEHALRRLDQSSALIVTAESVKSELVTQSMRAAFLT